MISRANQPRAVATSTLVRVLTSSLVTMAIGVGVAAPTQAARTDAHNRQEPAGRATRTVTLKENAYLHSIRREGSVLNERGQEYGTFNSPLSIRLSVGYTTSSITFSASPKGGTISGEGRATFYVSGLIARFSGTLWIKRGTGAYVHASAPRLQISGTLQRKTYALTATFIGTISM
jgi:hypothetical protein